MKSTLLLPLAALPLLLASCGERNSEASDSGSTPTAEIATDAWFSPSPPAAPPQAIHLVRHQASPGDTVTVSGRLMGRSSVFVDGRATFILGDPAKLTPCNEIPGDECTTPWDACCDTAEAKREGIATVQLVDENGRVLATGLRGRHGLTELSTVTVEGKVAAGSTPEAFVIEASRIHVAP